MRQCASRKLGEPIPFHGACWWPPREKGFVRDSTLRMDWIRQGRLLQASFSRPCNSTPPGNKLRFQAHGVPHNLPSA